MQHRSVCRRGSLTRLLAMSLPAPAALTNTTTSCKRATRTSAHGLIGPHNEWGDNRICNEIAGLGICEPSHGANRHGSRYNFERRGGSVSQSDRIRYFLVALVFG